VEEWEVDIRRGLGVGIGLMIIIFLVDVGLIWLAADRQLIGVGTYAIVLSVLASLGLLGMLGYLLYGLADSGYFLDRNALIIHWGPTQQIIPMGDIELVLTGDELEGRVQYSGVMWPGHFVGYGAVPDVGPTLFYASLPPQKLVYVVTPGLTYGISPAYHDDFLVSLRKRLQMGPTQIVEQSSRRPGFLSWSIWQDRLGLALLGTSLLALLVLVGLLAFEFPGLPSLVPLHFDAAGNADRLGSRVNIFTIPLIGLLAFLSNGALGWLVHNRERVASYLLWGGSLLAQLLVWVAGVGILRQI
jgi:hypothetical protein